MNLQLRITLFHMAFSIYAFDFARNTRMLAHFHVGYGARQYGFVWFRAEPKEVRRIFGRTFKWLYPRKSPPAGPVKVVRK